MNFTKLIEWIKNTKELLTFITVVSATIGVVTLNVLHNGKKEYVDEELQKDINVKFETIICTQQAYGKQLKTQGHNIDSILRISNENSFKFHELGRKQDALKNIVTKEFAKTMTPLQMLEMWNEYEKKKTGISSFRIPLRQNDISTQ